MTTQMLTFLFVGVQGIGVCGSQCNWKPCMADGHSLGIQGRGDRARGTRREPMPDVSRLGARGQNVTRFAAPIRGCDDGGFDAQSIPLSFFCTIVLPQGVRDTAGGHDVASGGICRDNVIPT